MTPSETVDSYLAGNKFPESTFKITMDNAKHYLGRVCKRGHEYEGSGKTVRSKSHRNCMVCMRLNAFVWKDTNRERAIATCRNYDATENGKARRSRAQKTWRAKPGSNMILFVRGAIGRAIAAGIPCDITQEFMDMLFDEQGGACYWTGVPLRMEGPARHSLKPSIDRLVPALGYTIGNVVWTSNFANRARGDMPACEFHEVVLTICQHASHKHPPIWCHKN